MKRNTHDWHRNPLEDDEKTCSMGEDMTSFAAELLKFGVAIDECSHTDKTAVCCLDLVSINKVIKARH